MLCLWTVFKCVDVSYPNSDSNRNTASKDESLNQELCLSAMLFTTLYVKESETESEDIDDFEVAFREADTLEDAMETEGLRYVGGYIAKKFPQYQLLESDVGKENTWIGFTSRKPGKLKNPSHDFFAQNSEIL